MIDKKTKYIKIGDVLKIGNGYAFKSKDFQRTGIPLLRISNIKYDRVQFDNDCIYLQEENMEKYSPFIVNKGDVVIALSGATTGKYGIYTLNEPCLLNQRIGIIKSGESKELHSTYFYYCLGKLKKEILRKAQGAAQPNISTKELGQFKIPLPPLETQKKIAEILDAADTLRQKTKTLIEKYDQLTQSLFLDIFGDPVKNPNKWDLRTIENVCFKIVGGGTPSKRIEKYYTGNIPWVTPKDMKTLWINNSIDHITVDAINKSSAKLIESQALLMVIRSGILKKKLPVAINKVNVAINQDMKAFIPNKKLVLCEYLLYFFLSIQKQLLKSVRSVTADNIEFKLIKTQIIPLPPLPLQNKFAERVQAIEEQKAKAQVSLDKAEELFQSLLQKAFKGEIN